MKNKIIKYHSVNHEHITCGEPKNIQIPFDKTIEMRDEYIERYNQYYNAYMLKIYKIEMKN